MSSELALVVERFVAGDAGPEDLAAVGEQVGRRYGEPSGPTGVPLGFPRHFPLPKKDS